MLTPSRSKSVGVSEKVRLVYLFEYSNYRLLNDLIFRTLNTDRSFASVSFWNVYSFRRLGLITSAMYRFLELFQTFG